MADRKLAALVEHALLDHLVCLQKKRLRDRQRQRLGGLRIDNEVELRGLFHGQICGLCALEDLVHVGLGASEEIDNVRSVGHEPPEFHIVAIGERTWQPSPRREVRNKGSICIGRRICCDEERLGPGAPEHCEGFGVLMGRGLS
jgi:hypothetical protein